MAFIDYYKILGVDKQATPDDIKKAYRKLARKYHPDLNPNDKAAEAKFKEINEANEVLSSPENRKKYDAYGENWKHADEIEKARQQQQQYQRQGGGGSPFGAGQGGFESGGSFFEGDYSDFFESMFGGGAGPRAQRGRTAKYRGQDIQAELHLKLEDVYTTHKRTLNVGGNSIRLTIPAGIKDGQTIKIKGQGGEGVNGGPQGDLYLTFSIENTTRFSLDGDDLYTTVDLDLYTAVLGGTIQVDAFDGKLKVKVNPETQNGTKVRLKGKGFPVYKRDGEFGDLYITFQVHIPTNLTAREKELFEELAQLRRP